ncbi:hypothetical protein DKM44_02260 [Deinococcus irradiatisoli]|uniref:Uncharacterized protein n=1 Tax=Deinococcus irradiatisoli TaxID=2202254 RepID=A0A2Z3JFE2_9DEIO|nr:hypothetical protein [Deinococcus irradiatisoli]AWN22201.1 hypothetical protein DKM44_02260 [Deinococcus irradiatisoli]
MTMQPIYPHVYSDILAPEEVQAHLQGMVERFVSTFTSGTIAQFSVNHSTTALEDGRILVTLMITGMFLPHNAEAHQDAIQPTQN